MALSDAKKRARDNWDKEHMAYQTIKVRRELLDQFRAECARRGDKINTVLRQAIESYVARTDQSEDQPKPPKD